MQLEEKLQACLQRESSLVEKPEGGTRNPLSRTQMDELSGLLKRADFFLHLILQSALIVIAHQDSDLRYRFIFNHYPTLADEGQSYVRIRGCKCTHNKDAKQ
ncbi:probable histidine kinase 1 [Setaria italica]|uniref:probable histidine kinase 1 n=1 Tax=Setaria italica TaxID=4555 RepID=UPI000BE5C6DB|nr:probable histidine kinase 1 [Setaria italica]